MECKILKVQMGIQQEEAPPSLSLASFSRVLCVRVSVSLHNVFGFTQTSPVKQTTSRLLPPVPSIPEIVPSQFRASIFVLFVLQVCHNSVGQSLVSVFGFYRLGRCMDVWVPLSLPLPTVTLTPSVGSGCQVPVLQEGGRQTGPEDPENSIIYKV